MKIDIPHLVRKCAAYDFRKYYLFLHSWEIIILFGLVTWFVSPQGLMLGIFIGLTQHMIFDQAFNHTKPLGYFLLNRLKNKFAGNKVFNYDAVCASGTEKPQKTV